MREFLAGFHPNWAYHERPRAGHWWGNQCVDWPPLFEFMRRNIKRRPVASIEFTTVNPGVSSRCEWVEVITQRQSLLPSTVTGTIEPRGRQLTVSTKNVLALGFDLGRTGLKRSEAPIRVVLDGHKLEVPWAPRLQLQRDGSGGVALREPAFVADQEPRARRSVS